MTNKLTAPFSASVMIGPTIPPNLLSPRNDDSDSEDDVGPAPPPQQKETKPQQRAIGPTLPSYPPTYNPTTFQDDDSDDDDFGPKPLPVGMQHETPDAVKEFIEREERMRKLAEEAAKPKAPKRDEWMLVPPSASDLLAHLDPSKMKKARQFQRGSGASSSKTETSLWTETPAERQQRLADEVMGKKRKATDPVVDPEVEAAKRRKKDEEAAIKAQVEEYNRKNRGSSLMQQHSSHQKDEGEDKAIWDHSRDMAIGGRLMDDKKRNAIVKDAKTLNDRFQSSRFS